MNKKLILGLVAGGVALTLIAVTAVVGLVVFNNKDKSTTTDKSKTTADSNGNDTRKPTVEKERTDAIFANATQSVSKIYAENELQTAEMEMDMSMSMLGQKINTTATITVDVPNQKMAMDMQMELYGENINMEMIIIGNTYYMRMIGLEGFEDWQIIDEATAANLNTGDIWAQMQDASTLSKLEGSLEDIEYEFIGEENINGVNTYKYTLSLDDEILNEVYESLLSGMQSGLEDFGFESIKAEGVEIQVWIDPTTEKVVQESMKMDKVTYTFTEESKTPNMSIANIEADIRYISVNEPVTIEAPVL